MPIGILNITILVNCEEERRGNLMLYRAALQMCDCTPLATNRNDNEIKTFEETLKSTIPASML